MEKSIFNLKATYELLARLTNDASTLYRYKTRYKMKFGRPQLDKYGKVRIRETLEPRTDLKFTQREITALIQQKKLPNSMYGGVPGRNNILNAANHAGNNFFFTVDLKDFFLNISYKTIHQTLLNNGFNEKEARIITKLTTLKSSLPQGAPSSTPLANLVFAPLSSVLENFCNQRKITFTSFVDDLAFSSKQDFKGLTQQIIDLIRQHNFFVNNNKIRYRRGYCEITGLIVKNGRLHLEKEMLENISNPGIKAYADTVKKQNEILRGMNLPLSS